VEVVEAVIRRAGGSVHLIGHSFGGLVSLAVAMRGQVPLSALVIAEAPALELLRTVGDHTHYNAFRHAITGTQMRNVAGLIMKYLGVLLLGLLALIFVPQFSLWLPAQLGLK
jgi:pimeloyl-ACP methyl ester carboxylesterase